MTRQPIIRGPNRRDASAVLASETYPSFLGRGWSFPPTFDRTTATVVMVAGDHDIRDSLWIILSTNIGERIMLATFGSSLWSQVFTALTPTTANEIAHMVGNAIIQWEPRVQVEDVVVRAGTPAGWLDITIQYLVSQTNTRSNLVYPFYLREPALPAPPG